MARRVSRAAAVAAVATLAVAGCDRQGFGDAEGRVTFDGKPLPAGSIVFSSEDDVWIASGYLKGDGSYAIPKVPSGPVRVIVRTDEFKGIMDPKVAADLRKKGLPAPEYDDKVKGFKYVKVPDKYADRNTSPFRADVKKNEVNKLDFDLSGS